MDGVDRGYQLWEHGADFYSRSHFKKWYKCGHLGLCDFGLLKLHIYWNMSYEKMVVHGVVIHEPLHKWELRDIFDE